MPFDSILKTKIQDLSTKFLPAGQDGTGAQDTSIRSVINDLLGKSSDPSVKQNVNNALSSLLKTSADSADASLDDALASVAKIGPGKPGSPLDPSSNNAGKNSGLTPGDYGDYQTDGYVNEYGTPTVTSKFAGLSHLHPKAARLADDIVQKFGRGGGLGGDRLKRNDSIANGDHPKGLAIDWSSPSIDQGSAVFNYAIENAASLGVKYVIFNGRIWNSGSGIGPYNPPPGEGNHSDHVHISLYG
jgi:hypothetical protein